MLLSTPVNPDPLPFTVDHGTPLLSIGSCFADEMGNRLVRDGFDCLCNPFGTLYNPLSIAAALQMALDDRPLSDEHLVQHDGLWHSWMHHSRFSSPDRDECLARCNQSIHTVHQWLLPDDSQPRQRILIVTFGTAWVFYHHGQVVANCHKLPAAQFERRRLTVDEIVSIWQPLLAQLSIVNCQLSILFTVSPIRHLSDTPHGNQLSKSTLLMAVDQLGVPYFGSYEILLDELRDYRFYARDMCHPSDLAADIVYERFLESCTSPATRQQALLNRKQSLRTNHRPIMTNKRNGNGSRNGS